MEVRQRRKRCSPKPMFKHTLVYTQDLIMSVSLGCHRTDSNVLVNLVSSLSNLQSIDLNVGPLFAPEHLDEMIEEPRPCLRRLSLRFNP